MNWKYLAALGCILVVGFFTGKAIQTAHAHSTNSYSVRYLSTAFDDAGKPTNEEYKFLARRADGSRAEGFVVDSVSGAQPTITKTISLVPQGVRVYVHGLSESTSTTKLSENEIERLKTMGANDPTCLANSRSAVPPANLGNTTYLGFEVVKQLIHIRNTPNTLEQWKASALNCEALYSLLTMNGSKRNETKAVSVKEGEPDPSFFSVPANYQERSPGEIQRLAWQKEGIGPVPPATQKRMDRADQVYQANKATPVQTAH
ncbi:MAG TPA: hypothetical protein VKX25_21940 [Bryobacteraceae bacterium]|jgi:hypothetical protein|nr:hypothetical protein [Bryobacteraceae bacterium]